MRHTARWLLALVRRLGRTSPTPNPSARLRFQPALDHCESREATNALLFGGLRGAALEPPLADFAPANWYQAPAETRTPGEGTSSPSAGSAAPPLFELLTPPVPARAYPTAHAASAPPGQIIAGTAAEGGLPFDVLYGPFGGEPAQPDAPRSPPAPADRTPPPPAIVAPAVGGFGEEHPAQPGPSSPPWAAPADTGEPPVTTPTAAPSGAVTKPVLRGAPGAGQALSGGGGRAATPGAGGMSAGSAAGGMFFRSEAGNAPLDSETETTTLDMGGTQNVRVTSTVTVFTDHILWEYAVYNESYVGGSYQGFSGYWMFDVAHPGVGAVSDLSNDVGWDGADLGASARWVGIRDDVPQPVPIGSTAHFSFTSSLCAIGLVGAKAGEGDFAGWAEGQVLGPVQSNAQVIFKDVANNPTIRLKVAKWQNSFDWGAIDPNTGSRPATLKANFIDPDPDRFYVYVTDPAANKNPNVKDTVTVQLKTSSDPGNNLTLEETGPNTGNFWSPWLMLVSNSVDDLNDKTFRVKLDDNVTATYTDASNAKVVSQATVPTNNNVKVHVNILRAPGGAPVATLAAAQADIDKANEQYAQVGIKLVPTFQIVDSPAGVDLSNGLDVSFLVNGIWQMTPEEQALLGAAAIRTAATDDVELYYVNKFTNFPDGRAKAFWASGVPVPKYADSVIIAADKKGLFTVPHEIGHVLLDSGAHFPREYDQINLMRLGTSDADGTTESKRLTPGQEADMLSKRPNLLTGP
jgi:hypothetical protein